MRVCKVYSVPTYHISDIQVKFLVLSVSTAKGIYYIITAPAHCRLNTVHNTVAPQRADTLVLRLSIFSNFLINVFHIYSSSTETLPLQNSRQYKMRIAISRFNNCALSTSDCKTANKNAEHEFRINAVPNKAPDTSLT